jgi:hypothetical protein
MLRMWLSISHSPPHGKNMSQTLLQGASASAFAKEAPLSAAEQFCSCLAFTGTPPLGSLTVQQHRTSIPIPIARLATTPRGRGAQHIPFTLSGGDESATVLHHVGALRDAGRIRPLQGLERGQARCLRGRPRGVFPKLLSLGICERGPSENVMANFGCLVWDGFSSVCRSCTRSLRLRTLHGRYVLPSLLLQDSDSPGS